MSGEFKVRLNGVDCVHDLHVWATGTTEVVLTAHVVMPAGHPDDAFFRAAAARMRQRFAIGHVTLQASTEPVMPACGGPMAPSASPGDLVLTASPH